MHAVTQFERTKETETLTAHPIQAGAAERALRSVPAVLEWLCIANAPELAHLTVSCLDMTIAEGPDAVTVALVPFEATGADLAEALANWCGCALQSLTGHPDPLQKFYQAFIHLNQHGLQRVTLAAINAGVGTLDVPKAAQSLSAQRAREIVLFGVSAHGHNLEQAIQNWRQASLSVLATRYGIVEVAA